MTIISLDFSILYPGVCICKDFRDFKWMSVINAKLTKKHRNNLDDLVLQYPSILFDYTLTKRRKDPQYHITERIKLQNYEEATSLLISLIKREVDLDDDILIAIEGMSFGSKGNSLIDLAQSTGIIKSKLINEILDGDHDRLFVFSPGELKNAIGCKGNAGKNDVFDTFKADPILETARTSDLYRAATNEDWFIANNGNVVSPIMDMIDAYLGVVKFHQTLGQN